MNMGELLSTPGLAETRVLEIQTKLHRWAGDDSRRRFDDVFNLVVDPAFLVVAWRRVRGNTGSRTAGIDGQTARDMEAGRGAEAFLTDLRQQVKSRMFRPLPVRERLIPKPGGIMPLVKKSHVDRMIGLSGANIPARLSRIIARFYEDPASLMEAGIAYATEQIMDLLSAGADGIHLYVMNNVYVARKITENVRDVLDFVNGDADRR